MLDFTASEVRGAILGIVGTVLLGGIGWVIRKSFPIYSNWNAKQNETELQAATRLASNTDRLIGFIGVMVLTVLGAFALAGGLWSVAQILKGSAEWWVGLFGGCFFGALLIASMGVRTLAKVADAIILRERERN